MMAYLNCHFALEHLRKESGGPRVMLIGPEDSGKTSLIKIFSAYALKLNRHPLVVNLDTREVRTNDRPRRQQRQEALIF